MTADDNFLKNVELWKITQPQWAQLLETITCSVISFSEDKRNLTAQVDGIQRFFYPPENMQEAEKDWISQINTKSNQVLFIYGMGLGYHYEALKDWLHGNPKRRLVVFEDNLEVVHRFFETALATEFLEDKQVRLNFISWPLENQNNSLKESMIAYCFDPSDIVCLDFYKSIRADRYHLLKEHLSSSLWMHKKVYSEILNSNRFYFPNYFRNLEVLPNAYQASLMRGKFAGIPAIICGAGPSLGKNINVLKTLSNRALIFGAGTSMNALNSLGFIPHFGVGIDPNEAQFERILTNNAFEVPFFYRNRIYPEALKLVQGDRLYVSGAGTYTFPNWFEEQLGIETLDLDEGYNVINFSLSIAEMLGCNPIILVGVDLAYTDNQSYAPHLKEHALSHQANSFITKSPDEELIIQKDIYGKPIYTLWKWKNEANWIGEFAKMHPHTHLINATEGGLGFPEVSNETLLEIAATWMQGSYDFRSMIHDAIQESQMPSSVNANKSFEMINSFKVSLENCRKIYFELGKEYQSKEKSIDKILKLSGQLEDEVAQRICLKQIQDVFEGYLKTKVKLGLSLRELAEKREQLHDDIEAENCLFLEKYIRDALKGFSDQVPPAKKEEPIRAAKEEGCLYYASGALKVRKHSGGKEEYFYENGVLKTVISYKEGSLHGLVSMFYSNGIKKREITFKNGLRNGFERFWSESGQLLIEAEYQEDKPIHRASSWYGNGQSKLTVHYDEEGREKEIEEWDQQGIKKAAKSLDYFDQLIATTNTLSAVIDNCFMKIEDIAKRAKINASEFITLKKDLVLLKEANAKIQATFSRENFKEPIWKSDLFQQQVQHQIAGVIDKMIKDVNNIYQEIEKMVEQRHG